jgi:hypothetical protein
MLSGSRPLTSVLLPALALVVGWTHRDGGSEGEGDGVDAPQESVLRTLVSCSVSQYDKAEKAKRAEKCTKKVLGATYPKDPKKSQPRSLSRLCPAYSIAWGRGRDGMEDTSQRNRGMNEYEAVVR